MSGYAGDVENYQPVSYFANRIPAARGGRRTAPSTIARWIARGVKTPTGVVRLQAVRLGGRWLTTEGWWAEFLELQTRAYTETTESAVAAVRSPSARNQASEMADAELRRMGC